MTIKDLMQQDPREFFGFDDPRAIQEVLADDNERERTSDDHEQAAFYEQSQSFRDSLGAGWQH